MHTLVKCEVFRGCKCHFWRSYTLNCRVVRKIREHNRSVYGTRFLKRLNKEVGLLKGNTHGGKDNGEFFISRAYLRLPRYLSGKLCVRKTRSREDGKLLTSYKGVKSVYRGNARLYKFLRISSRRRIHRHTVYIHSLFGDYFGAAVYGPAESVKYSAEHILGNSELHHSAEEAHLAV